MFTGKVRVKLILIAMEIVQGRYSTMITYDMVNIGHVIWSIINSCQPTARQIDQISGGCRTIQTCAGFNCIPC